MKFGDMTHGQNSSLFQAPRESREGEGEGAKRRGTGERKRWERRGACNHFLKHLMPPTFFKMCQHVKICVVFSLGHKLLRNEELSSVSCLTCARTLARIYGTFKKLTGKSNAGFVAVTGKRFSSNSPTGMSPSAKRTRELLALNGTSRGPRRSLNLSSENQAPVARVTSLEDQMNLAMNLDSASGPNSGQTVMKVKLACLI